MPSPPVSSSSSRPVLSSSPSTHSPRWASPPPTLDSVSSPVPIIDGEDDDEEDILLLQQQRDLHKLNIYEKQKQQSPRLGVGSPQTKSSKAPPSPPKGPSNSVLIALYSSLLLVSSVANNIYFKKMINHMENHVYFLNQLTSFVFVPVFFVLVLYELRYTDFITSEMRQFPKGKFFIMGIFDAVCGVLTMFGAVHTAGSTQALLSNSVIPITMVLSYVILKQRFKTSQYVGAAIIMCGIGFVLWPQVVKSISGTGQSTHVESDIPLFNLLFLLSVVPGALSSIYKELAFHNADIDANYLQFWVALWQFIFGFVLIPLNSMPMLGTQYIPMDKLVSALSDGTKCLFGVDVVVPPYCGDDLAVHCDNCQGAYIPLCIYLCFNLCFNMFSVLLIKYGSATLMFIIMTLRLPLLQVAFAVEWINDPPDPIQWTSGAGLCVILSGLIMYKWPRKTEGELEDDEDDINLIIPGVLDNRSFQMAQIRAVKSQPVRLQRSASQIRSALYSQLGVIDSPPTPHSPAARKFNFQHSSRSNQQGSPQMAKGATNGSPMIGIHSNVNNGNQSPTSTSAPLIASSSPPSSYLSFASSSPPLSSSPTSVLSKISSHATNTNSANSSSQSSPNTASMSSRAQNSTKKRSSIE